MFSFLKMQYQAHYDQQFVSYLPNLVGIVLPNLVVLSNLVVLYNYDFGGKRVTCAEQINELEASQLRDLKICTALCF